MAKQKKKSNRLLYWGIGSLVVLILILIVGKSQGWIGKSRELEVELGKAKKVSITEKVSASGTVQPVIEVKIAPEVSGEIIELNVEDGDSVRLAEPLVKIRPDILKSQLERNEALLNQQHANVEASKSSISVSQANLEKAELDYKRQEKLHNEKVVSDADWQTAVQAYMVAKNNLLSANKNYEASKFALSSTEASVREARENVRKTTVVAPMKGIVSKLSVKKGERVVGTATMTGTEMLRIADLNVMEVRVNVNENDIVRVHLRDTVVIDVDAYSNTGKQFKGLVTNIANTAKDKTSTDAITEFEVRILILRSSYDDLIKKGNKYPFRPGMTASVEIITQKKNNVLSVPLSAVTTRNADGLSTEKKQGGGPDDGGPQNDNSERKVTTGKEKAEKKDKIVVFVNEKGTAKMKEVKTGISDYDNIEILSGLPDSVEVITGPFLVVSKRVKDGDKVIAAKKEEKKEEGKK
ncbi:MAG: efflux RND transporter periplasmic adaptor subunit [Bacteroidetes bacterium]|nr:efflux RND transporter periplasmic adaptor subunit [Bacteroidota bacterium]MBS1982198.1 efflux RND transporter periplasmic adaptor subunit [Bacteroidota bacterium]